MKQPEENNYNSKENEKTKIGNDDNAENVNSLQQTLEEKERVSVENFSEAEIEYICMKITPRKIRAYFQEHHKESKKFFG